MSAVRPDAGKSGSVDVNFLCQRCHQPLRLDNSFKALDDNLARELTAPLTSSVEKEETLDLFQRNTTLGNEDVVRRVVPPSRYLSIEEENGSGFTLLGETTAGAENLSLKMKEAKAQLNEAKVTAYLFDVMSGQSHVDHPLCEECTDTLLDQLDNQLRITEDECRDYREFLETLGTSDEKVNEEALDTELAQLRAEEQALQQQLESVSGERTVLAQQIQQEKEIAAKLDKEEINYFHEYSELKRQLQSFEDEARSVENQLRYAQTQLDKLKKTNVFNATFHIWHSGHFGTINNFRLGRLPSVPVDWNEINAAWGQTTLLLHSLARKMDLTFKRYRLVPNGNHSYLESLTDKSKELPLYGSGGFRFFWDTKFDQAMVAFLDCLQQFKEEVEKGDTGFCLPYKMEKGKIEDPGTGTSYSVKIQFNSEEQWTKALKFMLTNLKWGLAWVSSQFANK
ncbi:beclin-1-like [Liolophura sinensis]|uniref:beclin-1-like n=1 Tax=Liolophura sinensis TaxID=3198878 RepID=UPI0031590FCE